MKQIYVSNKYNYIIIQMSYYPNSETITGSN